MTDLELKKQLHAIKTPPCAMQEQILRRLHQSPQRPGKKRLILLLAAALFISAALLGARQIYEWQLIHPDGTVEEAQVAASEEASYTEACEETGPLVEAPQTAPGQLLLNLNDGMMATTGITGVDTEDMGPDDVRSLVKGASPGFRFPTFLPDGYTLDGVRVRFYIPAEWKSLQSENFIDAGNGYSYQLFTMPEGWEKNLWSFTLTYRNPEGEFLKLESDCVGREPAAVLGTAQARNETVKLSSFGTGSYVEDSGSGDGRYALLMSEKIPMFSYVEPFALGASERSEKLKKEEHTGQREREQNCREISYTLYSDTLAKETLIKIAEGLR